MADKFTVAEGWTGPGRRDVIIEPLEPVDDGLHMDHGQRGAFEWWISMPTWTAAIRWWSSSMHRIPIRAWKGKPGSRSSCSGRVASESRDSSPMPDRSSPLHGINLRSRSAETRSGWRRKPANYQLRDRCQREGVRLPSHVQA
jgi:hypothetical protein